MKRLLRATAVLIVLGLPIACTATLGQGDPTSPTPGVTPTPGATPSTTGETRLPTPQEDRVTVVFHPAYLGVYSKEAAAAPGRIEAILEELRGVPRLIFTQPEPAKEEDLLRVHTQKLIDATKSNGDELYESALLSAGGALLASELAMAGEVSMAINRPPGHHASPDSSWGFCYFNNIAIAVTKLLDEEKIQSALIVDLDLHFGDGTSKIFDNPQDDDPRVTYYHFAMEGDGTYRVRYLEAFLSRTKGYDILAVSAGFDAGKEDWGGILEIQDYKTMGTLLRKAAEANCGGRRFAVLEGGYNDEVLGKNVRAFLDGFR